jgi:hypothetical protein
MKKRLSKEPLLSVGKEGLEPSRLAAIDPKSILSASSSTCPCAGIISYTGPSVNQISSIICPEVPLGRVINVDSVSKERTRLTRSIVLALRELMRQTEPTPLTYDLSAYIALALKETYNTIDVSVAAWEKRGYWVKADRFRMDWIWTDQLGEAMKKALFAEDWMGVARISVQIAEKLNSTKVPQRHQLGAPWEGAWDRLRAVKH